MAATPRLSLQPASLLMLLSCKFLNRFHLGAFSVIAWPTFFHDRKLSLLILWKPARNISAAEVRTTEQHLDQVISIDG
jgi:hypothetical protein